MNINTMNPITEDDIANYLANTPDFFERHAQLLAAVQLTSPHGSRAVSLQERQAEMLRDKIRALEQRIMEMIRNGSENVVIADKLQRWTRELFLAPSARDLPQRIVDELQAQFVVPQAAIRVWDVAPAFAAEAFAKGVSEDAKIFASSLTTSYCGVNAGFEAVSWLPDPVTAQSLVLIPLRAGLAPQAFGLIVLASPDSQRFNSGMGTDFLERIAELASAALSRLRHPDA
ncbi:DUF484 family protein [Polaromonas sp. C04]|uniref:DUF484 family protein n=1 Tax=Polaromonas sp. C04 TaxID=1945857 RepID=UPI00098643A1|nr:DUF484 family protein [Polaromonas sp. C04]OOG50663.1 hypothetical protein B0E49_18230 [Polaromonas sp. C04]